MQDLFESLEKLKFDKRMVKWNLNKKILTSKEYEAHLKSLKDISHLQNTEAVEENESSSKQDEKAQSK